MLHMPNIVIALVHTAHAQHCDWCTTTSSSTSKVFAVKPELCEYLMQISSLSLLLPDSGTQVYRQGRFGKM